MFYHFPSFDLILLVDQPGILKLSLKNYWLIPLLLQLNFKQSFLKKPDDGKDSNERLLMSMFVYLGPVED